MLTAHACTSFPRAGPDHISITTYLKLVPCYHFLWWGLLSLRLPPVLPSLRIIFFPALLIPVLKNITFSLLGKVPLCLFHCGLCHLSYVISHLNLSFGDTSLLFSPLNPIFSTLQHLSKAWICLMIPIKKSQALWRQHLGLSVAWSKSVANLTPLPPTIDWHKTSTPATLSWHCLRYLFWTLPLLGFCWHYSVSKCRNLINQLLRIITNAVTSKKTCSLNSSGKGVSLHY